MPQSTMVNKVNVSISIASIEDNSFQLSNHKYLPTDGKLKNVNYNITNTITLSAGKISMKMRFAANYKIDDTANDNLKSNPPVFEYTGTINFGITGIDLIPKDKSGKVDLPSELMTDLVTLAYNTFRGVLYNKAIHTPWVTVPLPVMGKEQIRKLANVPDQPNQ